MKKLGAFILITMLTQAWAASAINENIRLFEDTVWIGSFVLMFVYSLLMVSLSANTVKFGFKLLALTGLSGLSWKVIGVTKRVFDLDNPEWLFLITRETLEVFTGIIIGVAFFVLSNGFVKLFNSVNRRAEQQPQPLISERELA